MRRRLPRYRDRPLALLLRDRCGTAAIEFALCGPVFLALLIAIMLTGVTLFVQQTIQTVADQMARQVLTGKTQLAGVDADHFRQQTCERLPGFLSCARLMVDLRRADAFAGTDVSAPVLTYDDKGKISNNWHFEQVAPGDVVVLRVLYLWPVVDGPLGFSMANSRAGLRLLVGTQVFKAEPFA